MNRQELKFRLVGTLGRGLLGTYFPLIRASKEGVEHFQQFRQQGQPFIFVFWHGQLLPLVYYHRNEGVVVLVSEHADGEYIARVIHKHGLGTARGSSTRGAVKGFRGMLRAGREGKELAITPDGPRGPRHEFKWGALVVAQRTGFPVVPIGVGADRAWYLRSWDRFMIPKPFSNLRIRYGPPRWVPRDATQSQLEAIALDLQEEMKRFTLELNPAEASIREEIRAHV